MTEDETPPSGGVRRTGRAVTDESQERKMRISVIIRDLEELERLLGTFELAPGRGAVSGQFNNDNIDWSKWIENKKVESLLSWTEFSETCDIAVETIWRYRIRGDEPNPRSVVKLVQAFRA